MPFLKFWENADSRRWAGTVALFAVLIGLYPPALFFFTQTASGTLRTGDAILFDSNRTVGTPVILLQVQSVDPYTRNGLIQNQFIPIEFVFDADVIEARNDSDTWTGAGVTASINFTVVINGNTTAYRSNLPILRGTQTFTLDTGTILWYPFDQYTFVCTVYLINSTNDFESDENYFVPTIVVRTQSLNFLTYTAIDLGGAPAGVYDPYRDVQFIFFRPSLFYVYPIFVTLAMLAIITFALSFFFIVVVWQRKKIVPGNIPMLGSLIFAVPALRNSQPSVPPIGSLLDWVAFYWTELAVILNFCGTTFRYLRIRPPPPPPSKVAANGPP